MDKNIQGRMQEMVDTICGGNKSEFTRRIGRDNSAIKDIIGGRRSAPGYDMIYDILTSDMGISPNWLLLGEGPMLLVEKTEQYTSHSVHIENAQTVNIGNWGELVELLKSARQ